MHAGSMQLRKLRQLCECLFKLTSLPAVRCMKDPGGSAMQYSAAGGATLADFDVVVRLLHTQLAFVVQNEQAVVLHPCVKGECFSLWSQCGGHVTGHAGWIRDHPCYGGRCAR